MVDCKRFEPLRRLEPRVLDEVVREAEERLGAQLEMATAADQRALSIAAFEIASATAALAGGVALAVSLKPDLWLAAIALAFALGMVAAAHLAVRSVRPTGFNVPGNRPESWLPDNWMDGGKNDYTFQQARIEQAACLDTSIEDNKVIMDKAVRRTQRSIDLCICVVFISATVLVMTLIARNFTIREPTSEFVIYSRGGAKELR